MRKIIIALVLLVVGIGCFAASRSVSVFDSNNKLLLTTKFDTEDDEYVEFYDTDKDLIEVAMAGGMIFININEDDERSTILDETNESIQWDKFAKVNRTELTDDNGNVVGVGLGLLNKDGYLYVVLIYNE